MVLLGSSSAAQDYRRAYPELSVPARYSLFCSDWLFRMPTVDAAAAHAGSAGRGRTWMYEFGRWCSPIADGALGACHALEIPFVFGTLDTDFARTWLGETGDCEVALSGRMRRSWTAFATGGDPGWPRYDVDGAARVWGPADGLTRDPVAASRDIWNAHRAAAATRRSAIIDAL